MEYTDQELMDALRELGHELRHRRGPGFAHAQGDEAEKEPSEDTVPESHETSEDITPESNASGRPCGGPHMHGPGPGGPCGPHMHGPGRGGCGHGHGHGKHHGCGPLARERVLLLIDATGPINQRKMAELLAIRPQSLSELLAKLENDGLIDRQKSDDDKRQMLVTLTDAGKERSKDVEKEREAAREAFLEPLTIEERQQLLVLVLKLLRRTQDRDA